MEQAEDIHDLKVLLSLNGTSYEAADGFVVEFTASRTARTQHRPRGISYALVFRPKGRDPYVKFDNSHAVPHRGGAYVKPPVEFDHWHRTEKDPGRAYKFTTAAQLLDDFWSEVKRVMNEKGIPNDL